MGILPSPSEISPARAAALLDDLTAIVASACAKISALSAARLIPGLKADQSPVTVADEASEALIIEGVARLLPGVPVISEESAAARRDLFDGSFLIVDPLDGTREFLAGRDEFTVNLAIITGGAPIAGIIAAPARGRVWRGVVGIKAERLRLLEDGADRAQPIRTRACARIDSDGETGCAASLSKYATMKLMRWSASNCSNRRRVTIRARLSTPFTCFSIAHWTQRRDAKRFARQTEI